MRSRAIPNSRQRRQESGTELILDESVNVVLGAVLRSRDLEDVGDAEKCLLRLAVCHHLSERRAWTEMEFICTRKKFI